VSDIFEVESMENFPPVLRVRWSEIVGSMARRSFFALADKVAGDKPLTQAQRDLVVAVVQKFAQSIPESKKPKRGNPKLKRMVEPFDVLDAYYEGMSQEDVAAKFGVGARYLRKLLKKHAPKEWPEELPRPPPRKRASPKKAKKKATKRP
jgi:hypothetical protein